MTARMCRGCTVGDHQCAERAQGVPTGRTVPDTDPYRERTGWVPETVPCGCGTCAEARG